jgi:2-polyprenyl-6-methoxyphenol hydroxylase-like FAD-dependent oxidoreductase
MMLARQGHDVTVFERDREPVPSSPEDAWQAWERRGVAQFRQPHFLHAMVRHILDTHLPEVKAALLDAGCVTFDMCSLLPGFIADREPREGDERFVTVTGRRPIVEYAFARAAQRLVPVVRGTSIAGLVTGASAANGIPHITGVRTTDGEVVTADLVIDATGRSSKLPDWLDAIGARRPVEEADSHPGARAS